MEIQTPGLAEVLIAGVTDPDSLSPGDRRRFETFERGFYNNWEIARYYHRDGILNAATWNDWDNYFQQAVQERATWVWPAIRQDFLSALAGPKFHDHVDSVLAESMRQTGRASADGDLSEQTGADRLDRVNVSVIKQW